MGLLGPAEKLHITSKYGKGSKIGFLLYTNINGMNINGMMMESSSNCFQQFKPKNKMVKRKLMKRNSFHDLSMVKN